MAGMVAGNRKRGFAMRHEPEDWIGRELPSIQLGELRGDDVSAVDALDRFGHGRALIAGMPGAFTPVCSGQHAPNLVKNAPRLSDMFDHIACIVTSNPFSTSTWTKFVDPEGRVSFFSDGNREFARALGLICHHPELFVGEVSARYMITLREGVIESMSVERSVLNFSCTRTDSFLAHV